VIINRLVPMSGNLYQLIVAAGLILTAIFNPEGMAGAWRKRLQRQPQPSAGPDPGASRPAVSLAGRFAAGPEVAIPDVDAPGAAAGHNPGQLPDRREASPRSAPGKPALPAAREPDMEVRRRAGTPQAGGTGCVQRAVLSLTGVTVRYGGMVAADAVSLEVRAGQIVGIIGANGAGKTTLLDAISGFTQYSGSVQLAGRSIDELPAHRRARRGLARTWQTTELFADLTVAGNLAVAAARPRPGALLLDLLAPGRGSADGTAEDLLAPAGLTPLALRLPDQLTLAEQKLVSVARALALRPQALLLDEPAAGLSAAQAGELGRELRGVGRDGLGVLLVEHDVSLVMNVCDYVYVLDFGKLIAAGPPALVRRNPAVIAAYLGQAASLDAPKPPVPGPSGASAGASQ
jgi:branched-chain amino acid transport system ATP-binding protein